MAKVDMFLKLDGIEGESNDAKHAKSIHIESFSWGMSNAGTHGAGGGGGAGKVSVHDISISKATDKATPPLMYHCASGKHIASGLITCRKAGEKPVEYLKIKLEDILISGVQLAGNGPSVLEQVSLNFAKFTVNYTPQKPDGTPEAPVPMGWNVNKNEKI